MELTDFTKHALLDVVNGVEEANKVKDRFRLSSHFGRCKKRIRVKSKCS
jgi:hypothetical protein